MASAPAASNWKIPNYLEIVVGCRERHLGRSIASFAQATMSVSREGARLARALRQKLPANHSVPLCARGFTSTRVAHNASVKAEGIADIESASSFSAPQPDKDTIKAFEESQSQSRAGRRLPGNRCVLPSHAHVDEAMLIRTSDTSTILPNIIEVLCTPSKRRLHPIPRLAISFLDPSASLA